MSEERGKGVHASTAPGAVLATRYLVQGELGRGGMAHVLEVKDLRTDRTLALKILKPEIAAHPEAVERFRREGEFLSGLRHPALVTVEAVGSLPDGRLYLAMELLRGETLGERIRRGRLSPTEISPILAGAAVGLDAAHKAGVIHRDLKPDNVFLATTAPGGPIQVKLLDFGISKIDGRASLTRTGQVLGTPRYMAAEQLRGEADLDARVDVYALGVILYEALAGVPAFPAQQPSELILAILNGRTTPLRAVRPDISPDLEAVVARAMSKTREARFASAIELADAWFDVVHRNDGPKAVRAGFETNVLGSMSGSVRPPAPLRPEDLRPATFREFEMRAPPLPPEARGRPLAELVADDAMRSPESTTPAHAPEPRSRAAAVAMRAEDLVRPAELSPVRDPAIRPASALAFTRPKQPAGERAQREDSDPPRIPTRSWWRPIGFAAVVVVLVAGSYGITAVVRSLGARGTRGAPTVRTGFVTVPLAIVDSATATAARDAAVATASDAGARHAATTLVDIAPRVGHENRDRVEIPTDPVQDPDPRVTDPWVSTTDTTTNDPEPIPSDGRALLASAREAATSGDSRRCIELATEAIAAGVDATVYRLRGDCYRSLGDTAHALRSYQRFCTLAPSSSQIDAVRRSAEELGGSCP